MPVIYGTDRLTPAPICNITKSYKRLNNGQKIKPVYTIVLDGWIVANMGSPIAVNGTEDNIIFQTSGGVLTYPADTVDWTIPVDGQALVILKQAAIRATFSQDYKDLQIIPWNTSSPIRCFPRVISIEFPQDLWFKFGKYRITLEADSLIGPSPDESPTEDIFSVDSGNIGSGQDFDFVSQYSLEEATDTTSIEMDTENFGIFKVTRNVSAKGYRSLDSVGNVVAEGWQNARTWVLDRGGYNPTYAQSSVFGDISGGFSNYNHYRTQNTDIYGGGFSMTENWLLSSGNYYEDYSADLKNSITDPFRTVGVQGTIYGLSNFVVGTDAWVATGALIKYGAASGAWNNTVSGSLYTRAQSYIGIQLNPFPVNQTVTHNFTKGIISYNTEFNNRPLSFVSGAISETLTVIDDNPSGWVNVIAEHVILNRAIGSILQPINTTTSPTRSISYEAVFQAPTYGGSGNSISYLMSLKPREQVNQLLSGLVPTNYASGYLFITTDNENWSPLTQRYSRNVAYKYERNV